MDEVILCPRRKSECPVYLFAIRSHGLMYIINKEIFFSEDGHLENKVTDESVMMAVSTRRLFSVLIAAQGNPVERDVLCKIVWDDHGLRSSYSNLNQYVSILRKQLVQAGLPDDTIITVPRVGFMFNPKLEIQHSIKVPSVETTGKKEKIYRFLRSNYYYPVFILSVSLVYMFIFFVFYYEREPPFLSLNKLKEYPHECNVYALPGRVAKNKMEPVSLIAGDCEKNTDYFLFKRFSYPDDILIISCERSSPGFFFQCHNRRDNLE